MEGMELSNLKSKFDSNKGELQSASRSASIPSALGSMQFNSFGAMGSMSMISMGSQYFQCPIDVPFCERTYCVPPQHDMMNTESNAYACYSQPGCCFDSTLFQYRVAFGANFYQSVPVCYRAIDNQLFNQLASQVTQNGQFLPSFVQPLVNQVITMMANPMMSMAARQFQGCSARFGTMEAYNFINQVSSGNFMVASFVRQEAQYNEFVSTLTQECGWNTITENECILRGCCWNGSSNSCENPLGRNVTPERINMAMQYMMFKQTFSSNSANSGTINNANTGSPPIQAPTQNNPSAGGFPPGFGGVNPGFGGASPPGLGAIFGGLQGRKRRAGDESRSGFFSLLAGMTGGQQGGGQYGGGQYGGGQYGGGQYGGGANMGGMFGGALIGANEMCPATSIAKNCMAPSVIQSFDMMQKMMLERQCAAKECCWDNARYSQSMFNTAGSSNNLMCAWRAPDYSGYGMPSLTYSLRGCCDYSPCVERTGRDGSYVPPAGNPATVARSYTPAPPAPAVWSAWANWSSCSTSCNSGTMRRMRTCRNESVDSKCIGLNYEDKACYTNCDPVVWSPWTSYGCTRTCGGGYETVFRSCISGPCPTQKEIRHNQSCNQQISCGGSWGMPFWG